MGFTFVSLALYLLPAGLLAIWFVYRYAQMKISILKGPAQTMTDLTVLIQRIPLEITKSEFIQALREECTHVVAAHLIVNPRTEESTGSAFVSFSNRRAAEKCVWNPFRRSEKNPLRVCKMKWAPASEDILWHSFTLPEHRYCILSFFSVCIIVTAKQRG